MDNLSKIKEHAEVIGADGVHVGTVDRVEGDRIKLTKKPIAAKAATRATITLSPKPGRRHRGRQGSPLRQCGRRRHLRRRS